MSKYNTCGLLGQGLFSTVYLAEDSNGKQVALKYYTNKQSADIRQKFTVEAATLSQIEHHNILKIHDFGEDEKGMFVVMDYLEYGNLKGRIDAKGSLDLDRTLVVAVSVLKALEVLHNAGKVHADVRPENLFNSADGYLKLADFGTLLNKVPVTDFPASAFYYAAPEILEKKEDIDGRADIYSLGATLFHIFTGHPVIESDEAESVVSEHLRGLSVNVAQYRQDCPESFRAILEKMMQRERSFRYQDIFEVEQDLQAVMQGVSGKSGLPSYQNTISPVLVAPINEPIVNDSSEEERRVIVVNDPTPVVS